MHERTGRKSFCNRKCPPLSFLLLVPISFWVGIVGVITAFESPLVGDSLGRANRDKLSPFNFRSFAGIRPDLTFLF